MTPYTLSDRSWIYRLANFGHRRIYYQTDICTLLRAAGVGLFVITLLAAAAGLMIAFVASSLWNIFYMIVGEAEVLPTTIVFFGLLISAALIGVTEYVQHVLRKRRAARRYETPVRKQPGFISLAYQKFKNKTCVRIQFTPDGYDD